MKTNLLFLATLSTLCSSPAEANSKDLITGTSIVAIRSPDYLLIAADSKYAKVENNKYTPAGTGEKIRIIGDSVYSCSAGILSASAADYDVRTLIDEAIRKTNNLSKATDYLMDLLPEKFKKAMEILKVTDGMFYKEKLLEKSGVDVLIAGIEGKIPKMYTVKFWPSENAKQEISIKTERGEFDKGKDGGMITLGERTESNSLLDKDPHYMRGKSGIDIVVEFIRLEIAAHPENVGWPITVWEIPANGEPKKQMFN